MMMIEDLSLGLLEWWEWLDLLRNDLRLIGFGGVNGYLIDLLGMLEKSTLAGHAAGCNRMMRILLWFWLVW